MTKTKQMPTINSEWIVRELDGRRLSELKGIELQAFINGILQTIIR